ncbi:MAG: HK97 family phage prohead protease [Alphaproteobacteria bacterium]|nr:HK97 family phage prohead protease [Alphaproteobacteria bacterium]
MTDKKKLPELKRRAFVAPESVNAEERTIEIVWTTGARATQWSFEGSYIEELEVSEKAINMERLNSGNAPFLSMHASWDLGSILGVVEKAWIDEEKGEGRAIIRFGRDDEQIDRVWNLVAQGIIRNISVGYTVEMYEVYVEDGNQIYRAVKWTPMELSAVTIPADAKANVRAEALTSECVIVNRSEIKEKSMVKRAKKRDEIDEFEDEIEEDAARSQEDDDQENATPGENEDDRNGDDGEENENRNDDEEDDKERKNSKRSISRTDAILSLCEVAGMSISEARSFCKSKKSFAEIRSAILAKRTQNFNGVNNTRGVSTQTKAKTLAERAKEVYCKK